jgi:hypothetical protein
MMNMPNESYSSQDDARPLRGVAFSTVESGYGVEVFDQIDRHRYLLWTPSAVAPAPAPTDQFQFPVDAAVSIPTTAVTLPTVVPVCV